MKKLYKLLFLILGFQLYDLTLQAQIPDFLWANQSVGETTINNNEYGRSVATDAQGNTFVAGYFQGSLKFGSTILTSSGNSYADVFIAKYDASGALLWVKHAKGGSSNYGLGIAVDGSGNSYVTGNFQNTYITFGSTTLISSGGSDVFIAKYDASGTLLWAKNAGGASHDYGQGIAVDGSGNSYVTGYFQGSTTFGSTTLTGSGSSDVFIAKYDASGTLLWVKNAGGTSDDYGYGIAVDGSGNSYVTGNFQGSATFGSTILTSSSSMDVFIAKYDASGALLWAKKEGGISHDIGYDIAVDGSGNIYVTGVFYGSTTFGSTTLISSYDSRDAFIAKYDASGTLLWAKNAGGQMQILLRTLP